MMTAFRSAGLLLLVLAFAHAFFPRFFKWSEELSSVSLLTRQVFYVHHFFIALTVALMGLVTFMRADELAETKFGREICLGLSAFWLARLVCQFFVYSPELWRGKRFETAVHIFFAVLWAYLAAVYFAVGIGYAAT